MNAHTQDISLDELRRWIGRELDFLEEPCQVLEVLSDGPAVVLCCRCGETEIQGNQYGEANRRVPRTLTIPVYTGSGQLSDAFLALRDCLQD
ncbi:hypothetical protein QVG61_06795 [Thiohalobacter sp. IOR34]|uniref:hypothetical protein n=1 Tax=Thiohalobacter sp. IOR34 TaxID=3057176 RepID=UPI0025AF22C3|nr:hypothetical protein [Thiohalobacter sp. IOR34]WJW76784.1 hypothetical protein QVG61_06795 [Thiohalobacter sp. IOR34]